MVEMTAKDKKDTIIITVGLGQIKVHGSSHEVVVKKIGEK